MEKLFKAHKQGKISTLEVFEKLFAKNDPIKSIQIEEIIVDDTTDEIQLPSRLQELRKMFYQPHHYKIEQDLYTATYNHSIDIKLELQSESRKKGNILAIMPHPERSFMQYQLPFKTNFSNNRIYSIEGLWTEKQFRDQFR